HRPQLAGDPLIPLDESVDEELVGPGRELEVLERIDVEGHRDRGEVARDLGLLGDDPLDPARAVGDELALAEVAVRDRLLEERAGKVEHVLPARDDALVDEELRRRLAGHGRLLRGTWGTERTPPMLPDGRD